MNSRGEITRMGSLVLVLAGMVVALGSTTLAWEGVGGSGALDVNQGAPYSILTVSQPGRIHQRFQPQISSPSNQTLPRMKAHPDRHHRNSWKADPSPTVLPLILYPWNWGYNYGEWETPDDVLAEYLDDLSSRQEVIQEEEPAPAPIPTSPPLIIEEQCGKYVRLPWPEPAVLFEPREEPPCPSGE